jgi:hypothetical protein
MGGPDAIVAEFSCVTTSNMAVIRIIVGQLLPRGSAIKVSSNAGQCSQPLSPTQNLYKSNPDNIPSYYRNKHRDDQRAKELMHQQLTRNTQCGLVKPKTDNTRHD